jgi:hypothetical protein
MPWFELYYTNILFLAIHDIISVVAQPDRLLQINIVYDALRQC